VKALCIRDVSYWYGQRQAVCDLNLEVEQGQIFALLGPNGGGKTTLFRILATLVPLQAGSVEMLGWDLRTHLFQVRRRMGVVFQSPSLDRKLTVLENIRHQAALYGIRGRTLAAREQQLLEQLGVADRRGDLVETLSGGLRRRVELAKGMIHQPELLLMDEPSTGLDPAARADLWQYLVRLRDELQVTVVLTTHLLDEADKADRIGILSAGRLVAADAPGVLRAAVGGDSITIACRDPAQLAAEIAQRFSFEAQVVDACVRLHLDGASSWLARLVEAFPGGRIQSITLAQPTLEDVFIRRTGHRFWQRQEGGDE
jgi:ABC-2 type transport system ATP-binding protein